MIATSTGTIAIPRPGLRGFTLIEMLVAQLLGLILIVSALALFRPSISLFEQSSAAAMVRESGRMAMDTLVEDIQQAGYRGCSKPRHQNSLVNSSDRALSPALRNWAYRPFTVQGLDANAASEMDRLLGNGWNTRRFRQQQLWFGDVLLVQGVKKAAGFQVSDHDPEQHRISLVGDQSQVIGKGSLIGISDCHQSTMLQVDRQNTPVFHGPTNTTILSYAPDVTTNCVSASGGPESRCDVPASEMGAGKYQFGESSQVFLVSNSLYYLGVQPQTSYPSLYRMSMASDSARVFTEVIAEGVENMRFRYGIDIDGDATPDHYRSASDIGENITDWSSVVSIRLWLMTTSVDKRGQSRFARPVWFPDRNGVSTECKAAPDSESDACPAPSRHHPYRRVFSREINLRNARI